VLTGLGEPRGLFISPDGQWVGFFDSTSSLKKVSITGGPAVTIASVDGTGPRGASWSDSGQIVFASDNSGTTGLQLVPASGGEVTVVTKVDPSSGDDHWWPEFLPGGQAVLFTVWPAGDSADNAQIAVLDLASGEQKVFIRGGSHAHYVASGHLIYGIAGTLRAVPFDLNRLEVAGDPVPVLEGVSMSRGSVNGGIARDGTLVYLPGAAGPAERTLVWVDRQGREESLKVPERAYAYARLSLDGARIALDARQDQNDIWIWDLSRETMTRLTFDPGLNRNRSRLMEERCCSPRAGLLTTSA
jgi:serine/threonine-protein kinase